MPAAVAVPTTSASANNRISTVFAIYRISTRPLIKWLKLYVKTFGSKCFIGKWAIPFVKKCSFYHWIWTSIGTLMIESSPSANLLIWYSFWFPAWLDGLYILAIYIHENLPTIIINLARGVKVCQIQNKFSNVFCQRLSNFTKSVHPSTETQPQQPDGALLPGKKDRLFLKGNIFSAILKNNPPYCWMGKLSGKPVTPLI